MTEPRLTHVDETGAARMVDVSAKAVTAREATAAGRVLVSPEVVDLLRGRGVPKGDAVAVARIAGIAGAKRTPDLVPLCHPIALHGVTVDIEVADDAVEITATARTADRTGVEMEALTAVTVAGLTMIDMVKAVDPRASITDVRLLREVRRQERGVDPVTAELPARRPRAGVVTASNRASAGVYEDRSGQALAEGLASSASTWRAPRSGPTTPASSRRCCARPWTPASTSSSPPAAPGSPPPTSRPEATRAVLEREAPGIAEAVRRYGAENGVPTAVLSRGLAGTAGRTLIVNLPGSTGGVKDAPGGARPAAPPRRQPAPRRRSCLMSTLRAPTAARCRPGLR